MLRKNLFCILFLAFLIACGKETNVGETAVSPTPTSHSSPADITAAPPTSAATAATCETTRFAIIGDFGAADEAAGEVADLVKSWQPDFIATVGDNNYPDGQAETIDANIGQFYHAYIGNYQGNYGPGSTVNRFFPALGNHDWHTTSGNPPLPQPYLDYFTLPGNERYYTVSQGPVDLFILDSDENEPDGFAEPSRQSQWLQTQLAQSEADWKLVLAHHAPYSSGDRNGSSSRMRWPFAEWGATAVVSGHEHNYERLLADNIPYFVNGLGGTDSISGFEDEPRDNSQVRFTGQNGAMLIEATCTNIHYQFITTDGSIIDNYSQTNLTTTATTEMETLIPAQAFWHYLDDGSNQGTAWYQNNFNDTSWSTGQASLGYGDDNIVTVVSFGSDSEKRHITTYFRHTFLVDDPLQYNSLSLRLQRDDGAVVYLNGTEIIRDNMPLGPITFQTEANKAISGDKENDYTTFSVQPSQLQEGANVMAIEVHQAGPGSSDIRFDLELVGSR